MIYLAQGERFLSCQSNRNRLYLLFNDATSYVESNTIPFDRILYDDACRTFQTTARKNHLADNNTFTTFPAVHLCLAHRV